MNILASIAASLLITVGSWFVPHPQTLSPQMQQVMQNYLAENQQYQGVTQTPFGGLTYNLAGSGISSTANSLPLVSLTIPQTGYYIQSTDLGSPFFVTIEPGSRSRQEVVECTGLTQNNASGATLTGCSRGMSPIYPYTASTSLEFTHSGGAQVIFSDPPQLFNQYAALSNDQIFTGTNQFATPPILTSAATSSNQAASVGYVNGIAFGTQLIPIGLGGTNNTTFPSNVLIGSNAAATQLTATGTPQLTVGNLLATSTATSTYAGPFNILPVSATSTIAGMFAVNGTTTFSAFSTTSNSLILNNLPYGFPSIAGASSTSLSTDGKGDLSWEVNSTGMISTTTTVAFPTSFQSSISKTVYCVLPKVVSGGGFSGLPAPTNPGGSTNFTAPVASESYPSGTNAWTVSLTCDGNTSATCNSAIVTVYALCVNP